MLFYVRTLQVNLASEDKLLSVTTMPQRSLFPRYCLLGGDTKILVLVNRKKKILAFR